VYYRALDAAERAQLALISNGATFAEICEMIAAGVEERDPAIAINQRLETWLRGGVLLPA
jgi:hypothetical protein